MGPLSTRDDSPVPRYKDEDCRPTSKKELLGFYAYSCAAEPVVIAAVSSFIPMILEQLARERGVLQSDRSTSCTAEPPTPSGNSINSSNPHIHPPRPGNNQCIVDFAGFEINTASFAMYTFSISVLLQALLVITMSGAADHGRYRKTLLLVFAFTGAIATMLFLPVTSNVYALGALWAIVANVCLGASFVLLNAYIPIMVRWHPMVQYGSITSSRGPTNQEGSAGDEEIEQDLVLTRSISDEEHGLLDSTAQLLPATQPRPHPPSPAASSAELQLSTRISSNGIGFGYLAALFVQILVIAVVILTGSTTWSLRLALFMVGAWWFLLTVPAAYCLEPRPGPPIVINAKTTVNGSTSKTRTWIGYMTYSWKSLGRTILKARRLKDVLFFLCAWFLISDAIATVSGTAILFAKTTLGMKPAALALINMVTTVSGVFGAFTWARISRLLGMTPTRTIIACICLFEVIPLYGLLGFIPAVRESGVFGLQQPWEMYPLGVVYGFVLGGLSSYCRSLFGELIPEGSEAQFYALYAVTDKGSSVFGPAIVGAIIDATGDIRPAFFFLAILIGLPLPIMMLVDVHRGKRDKAEMAKELVPGIEDEADLGE